MEYNYEEIILDDVIDYLEEKEYWKDYTIEQLQDMCFISDRVTGNASGSYTFNTYQAEENLAHNWNLLEEALEFFGSQNENIIEKGAEWCDVIIRCYLIYGTNIVRKAVQMLQDKYE